MARFLGMNEGPARRRSSPKHDVSSSSVYACFAFAAGSHSIVDEKGLEGLQTAAMTTNN